MKEPWTHESDDDYIVAELRVIKRGSRIAGWCAVIITIILTGIAIYDKLIKPYLQQ